LTLFVLLLFVAPFGVGFVLDLLFGTRARWWRWWFPPLLPVLYWVYSVIRDLVEPADSYGDLSRLGAYVQGFLIVSVVVVMAAGGVWLRRWVARAVAPRPS